MVNTSLDMEALNQKIFEESAFIDDLRRECRKKIVGQEDMFNALVIGLLTKGHVLLEGLPGLAKTLTIKTLSQSIKADFQRIQFTPDLLPADILGTMIYNPVNNEFTTRKGPIFSNLILTDEINRAPAKVQSALLEAMQERQITIGSDTFKLEEPFLVLATQNPIEQEGTYALPEAQVDRFMLKVKVDYPSMEEEREVLQRALGSAVEEVEAVVLPEKIIDARKTVRAIYLDEKIEQYILDIVFATRFPDRFDLADLAPLMRYGGSPRATINIALAAKAAAFMDRRGYVTPDDVQFVLPLVMRHRIGLSYEAEAEEITTDQIIEKLVQKIKVP